MSIEAKAVKKVFRIIKTTPGNVYLRVHPIDNPSFTREVYLTGAAPQQVLPLNYALDIFANPGNYSLYKSGAFTFDDNEAVKEAAIEAGYYFDSDYDKWTPAKPTQEADILKILKGGVRAQIAAACREYGEENVKSVAIANVGKLTATVIANLEKLWGIQLTVVDAA